MIIFRICTIPFQYFESDNHFTLTPQSEPLSIDYRTFYIDIYNINYEFLIAAVVQSVEVFTSHAEGWEFDPHPRQN